MPCASPLDVKATGAGGGDATGAMGTAAVCWRVCAGARAAQANKKKKWRPQRRRSALRRALCVRTQSAAGSRGAHTHQRLRGGGGGVRNGRQWHVAVNSSGDGCTGTGRRRHARRGEAISKSSFARQRQCARARARACRSAATARLRTWTRMRQIQCLTCRIPARKCAREPVGGGAGAMTGHADAGQRAAASRGKQKSEKHDEAELGWKAKKYSRTPIGAFELAARHWQERANVPQQQPDMSGWASWPMAGADGMDAAPAATRDATAGFVQLPRPRRPPAHPPSPPRHHVRVAVGQSHGENRLGAPGTVVVCGAGAHPRVQSRPGLLGPVLLIQQPGPRGRHVRAAPLVT